MRLSAAFPALLSAVALSVAPMLTAVPAAAAPDVPDLSGYPAVASDAYVDGGELYFQTPDGLRFLSYADPGIRLPALPDGLITKPIGCDAKSRSRWLASSRTSTW